MDKGLQEANLIELTPPPVNLSVPMSSVHNERIVRVRTVDRWRW
jgi:hypothetical protein